MKSRLLLLFTLCAAVLLAPAAAAQDSCFVRGTCCSEVCSLSNPDTCLLGCETVGGQNTTCWQYFGQFDSDLDDDGVANAADNCVCNANANQANCDGDGQGDVCDPENVKWVLTEDRNSACWIDHDQHAGYFTLERYSSELWTNVCGLGGTCINRVFEYDADCFNVSKLDCCYAFMGSYQECQDHLEQNNCGSPNCPF